MHTYRIPALATTPKGTLLCVYDMRRRMGRDLQEDIDIGLVRRSRELLEMEIDHFFVLERDTLVPHASLGRNNAPAVTRRFALGEGIAGRVAKEGGPVLLTNARNHAYFVAGLTRPQANRSMIVVPVKEGDRITGVISVDQDRINAFDEQDLRASFQHHTKAIILNTPNNPTGKVFSRNELELIRDLCVEYNVLAITDEIYEHILYDGALHVPLATLPGMAERTITIKGIDKEVVGHVASLIRSKRLPEPYKGSGIRYADEIIKKKAGKKAATAA